MPDDGVNGVIDELTGIVGMVQIGSRSPDETGMITAAEMPDDEETGIL